MIFAQIILELNGLRADGELLDTAAFVRFAKA